MSESAIKYPGGKYYLVPHILELLPPREEYTTLIETHAGSAKVLLAHNPEGKSEIINDLDGLLTNFWTVLRNPETFEEFYRQCQATPFSRPGFLKAQSDIEDFSPGLFPDVEAAWAFFVVVRQSFEGVGESFAAMSTSRVRRGMNEQVSAWLSSIDGLPAVHQRLSRVVIENDRAERILKRYDKPGVVFYMDPPYVHNKRVSKKLYRHEMAEQEHIQLLVAANSCEAAKILISGYHSELYEYYLSRWNRIEVTIDNKASKKKIKPTMTEVIWRNY